MNVQILTEWLIKMRIVINIVYNAVVFYYTLYLNLHCLFIAEPLWNTLCLLTVSSNLRYLSPLSPL